ncbi:MAG: glycoside hydrolase family 27 protein [Ruminococcaceae bacterium]|nr:glycoside hydrolase family 27 protein [Oscillospiraceae bacterium]
MNKNLFAPTPPRGWNSYDYYDTNVREEDVLANASFMARHLKPYGWEYIVVDIQWYAYATASMRDRFQYIPFGKNEMDECGRLLPCPDKFPSSAGGAGFKPLADKIHALGLKFGIHIMRGIPRKAAQDHLPILGTDVTADMVADPSSIAEWNPDMYGVRDCPAGQAYYDSLLALYAAWGVDFIKVDDICATGFWPNRTYGRKHEVEMIHKAIEKCGRPIVLSLSPGPAQVDESGHYKKYANMWRITDDFWDNWDTLLYMFDRCEKWQDHVSPGCWPDCDMLPLGKVGKHFGEERDTRFTPAEQKTMMTLWCIFGSPLMLGAEMTKLDDRTLSLLQNEELLRLENGRFTAHQVLRDREQCVWCAVDPQNGEYYVALFNLTDAPRQMSVTAEECAAMFPDSRPFCCQASVKEVWSNTPCPELKGVAEAHGTLLFHGQTGGENL